MTSSTQHDARHRAPRGVTILEVLVLLAVLVLLVGMGVPMTQTMSCDSKRQVSINNLRALGSAAVHYAADWNDRQFTLVRDDLGEYGGSCQAYHGAGNCHPSIIAGKDCDETLWGVWFPCDGGSCTSFDFVKPINFGGSAAYVGSFRLPNVRGFHEYLNGRFFDRVFYAPKDAPTYEQVEPFFDVGCEFVAEGADLALFSSSYAFSPAAMYHPDVFRDPIEGGWQNPDSFDHGYQSPTLSQTKHPGQKTWMLEHNWLQHPFAECNPYFEPCEPYYFNHGLKSNPMTLFYDGHVRGLSTREAQESDKRHQTQTGWGLWSRDTPFGDDGYFTGEAADFLVYSSYHILTTDGIRGRDTLE